MRVVYQRHFLEHQQTCFLWYWKQSNIIFQRKQHNLTDYLAVIPPISTFRENELSQYIENLRHEGLTSEELEQREGVCQRIESILRGGGLTGKLTFYIKFISIRSLSLPFKWHENEQKILSFLFHFKQLISFYTPWKYQKTRAFLVFSRAIKRDKWHEMGWSGCDITWNQTFLYLYQKL